jgi:3D-(3,5/4)-trihydroxycyclohexane-1,2-dione acylhydrolase (decyclizing)
MGALGIHARTEQEIRDAIAAARAHPGVTVIHVAVSPDKRAPGYDSWWDVPVAEVSGSELVNRARDRYEEKLAAQRAELL